MPGKLNNWDDKTCDRFVAFMDIMGFKDNISRSKHEEIKDTLSPFIDMIDPGLLEALTKSRNIAYKKTAIKKIIFSDSIIFITENDLLEFVATLLIQTQPELLTVCRCRLQSVINMFTRVKRVSKLIKIKTSPLESKAGLFIGLKMQ